MVNISVSGTCRLKCKFHRKIKLAWSRAKKQSVMIL
jgi:hypothetical protein